MTPINELPPLEKGKYATVAEFLENPDRWNQGSLYKYNSAGEYVKACLLGACDWVYGDQFKVKTLRSVIEKLRIRLGGGSQTISKFNDDSATTHEMVYNLAKELGI